MPLARKSAPSGDAEQRSTYGDDFYSWTQEQGALLRAGRLEGLDTQNLAEEIESLGRNEFDKLVSFYRLVLLHMLKREHQPNLCSRSWSISIEKHRVHAADVLRDNPGLKPRAGEALERAYRGARLDVIAETGLSKLTFPATCPFTRDEMLTRPYEYD